MNLSGGNSREVNSNQSEIAAELQKVILRHIEAPWRKPISGHTAGVWQELKPILLSELDAGVPWILDSGCGTGESSRNLADLFPKALVIGVDQSISRLSSGCRSLERSGSPMVDLAPALDANQLLRRSSDGRVILARAELGDFWRLLLEAQIAAQQHYLLYPNPWPLRAHLKRRWHGHPLFSLLPQLSPITELRSNWKLYTEEFAEGWRLLGEERPKVEALPIAKPITPFEKKYLASAHPLWRVVAQSKKNLRLN